MEGFRGFGGKSHPQNSTFLILPNCGNLEGEERGVVSLILKRFKLSIYIYFYKINKWGS